MPGFLRQSTAAQSRALGPFVDDTDFKTPETGLTVANTDIKLVVNGAASANKNSGGGTHRVNGVYGVTFDATDTATVGEMEVSVVVAGALPVFDKFFVVEEAVYDAFFVAAAPGYNVAQIVASVSGAVGSVTGAVGSVAGAVGSVTGNVGGNVVGTVASVVGAVGSVTGAAGSVTGAVGSVTGAVGSLAAQAKADVNAEVVDVLRTDASAELSAVPAANAAIEVKIAWLFQMARNLRLTTATEDKVHTDAGAVAGTAALSDDATTFSKGEYA